MGELSRSGVTEGALSDPLTRATSPKGRGKEAFDTLQSPRAYSTRAFYTIDNPTINGILKPVSPNIELEATL